MNRTPRHLGVLQIEPTDVCNLSCSMCAPHHQAWPRIHGIEKGRMDIQRFERIVQALEEEDCRFDHLILQWLGDPSLHPELERMVELVQLHLAERIGYLRIDTNAILLTPKRMDALVALYARFPKLPLLLVFTIDAATGPTYERVKGQDALERVRRHVRRFLMQRARLELDDVRLNIELQFVVQRGNAHELGEFVSYWDRTLACHGGGVGHSEVMVKRLSVGSGGPAQQEADALYLRAVAQAGLAPLSKPHMELKLWQQSPWEPSAPGPRGPCPGLWLTPVIRHDGHLVMCCADLASELDLGPVHEHGFMALWEGERAQAWRLGQIQGRFEGPCESCGGIQWYELTPEHISATLSRAAQ